MKQMDRKHSLEELEAKLAQHEAAMKSDTKEIDLNEEIERSASFFTPFFLALLLTIAIFLIDKFVVS
jgi:hypothetical protein